MEAPPMPMPGMIRTSKRRPDVRFRLMADRGNPIKGNTPSPLTPPLF